ncbi:FKBP-type peptidyl-prolyl cis-trans isomerase [Buchnera aphidicola (Neophyllaphis varicolor)]|uniref:FKBP-type peptidyl-prolyl cis-trans isomerase n=1 Tax=Buchnera aphidicola TaxID=9 RepID=UPI0031B86607
MKFTFYVIIIILIYLRIFCLSSFGVNLKDDNFYLKKKYFSDYSLGVFFGRYIKNFFEDQEKMGIFLNKKNLILGLEDSIIDKVKLSDSEISHSLLLLDNKLKQANKVVLEEESRDNFFRGQNYINKFCKKEGVKKTKSGLAYLIKKIGKGNFAIDSSVIYIKYMGTLIDKSVFDSSYYRKDYSAHFLLKNLINGLQEGIKLIKKGGIIKLVIPPTLAYGKNILPGIPINSTLIFDVELLNIK